MILDSIKALLLANAGVSSLVDTRIYEESVPRDFSLPAVVYQTVLASGEYTFEGSADPNEIHIQFDFYANTPAQARAVQDAVRAVLENLTGHLSSYTVLGSFWQFDQDMPRETAINNVTTGSRKMSQVNILYLGA